MSHMKLCCLYRFFPFDLKSQRFEFKTCRNIKCILVEFKELSSVGVGCICIIGDKVGHVHSQRGHSVICELGERVLEIGFKD